MIRSDLAEEDLKTELQKSRNRVTELEAFLAERRSGGETLQQVEAEAVLESFNNGILVLDRKGRVIDANERLENILGYPRKEIIGKTALSAARLLTHKGLTLVWRNPLKLAVNNDSVPYEIDLFKKDGDLVTVQIAHQQLKDNAKIVGSLIILKDMTVHRRSERESRESAEVYKSLVNNVGIGIFRATAGPGGRFLQVNHAMEEITGYSREDLLKMNVEDLYVHPEERAEHIKEVLSGVPTQAWEVHFRKKDGTEITVLHKKDAVKGYDSKTLYIEGFLQDITKTKRAEAELKENEEKYKTLFENAAEGIVVVQDGLVKLVNRRLMEMTGYTSEEVQARPFIEFVHPEDRAMAVEQHQKRLVGETAPMQYPLRVLNKAGKTLWFQLKGSLITWANKTATLNMITDITEQKKAEIALKESEEKYRLMVETSNDLVLTFTIDEKLVYVSPSIKNMLDYNPSDLVGHAFGELVHPDDIQSLRQAIQRNIKNGSQTPGGNEYRVRHASGEWRWHVASGNAMFDADGKFINFTAIAKDITERKNAEIALQASENNFRASIDSSFVGIRIMGDADYTLYANQALLDMFGYKNIEELRASPPQEHYTSECYAGFIKRKEQFSLGESVSDQLDVDIIRKDGKVRHLQIFSKNVLWDGKQHYQFIYIDITERTQVEEALRLSEEKYRLIVENTRDVIFTLNPMGKYVYISPSIKSTLGYNQADLIGRPFLSLIHPEDIPIIQEEIRHTNKHGYQTTENREYRVRHASGEWRWVVSRGTKIVGTNGKFLNFVGIARDITEQKLIEEKLKSVTVRQGELLAAIPDIIMEVDKNKIYTWANQAGFDFFGDDVIGKEAAFYFEGEQDTYDAVNPLFNGEGNTFYVESRQRRKDGQKRLLAWRCRVLKDNDGNVTGALSSAQDITQNKVVEEALRASEQNFRNSIDSSLMGIRIVNVKGQTLYTNQAFQDVFGYENNNELNESPPEEYYTPESYADWVSRYEELARGEPVSDKVEVDIERRDGSIRHLKVFRKEVLWGGERQYQTLYDDITERKNVEKALQASEANFRNSMENSPMGIRIGDTGEQAFYVNSAFLDIFDYENIDEVKTVPRYERYTPESYANFCLIRERESRGELIPDKIEADIVRKDGTIRHIEASRRDVFWNGERHVQVIYNDITERKRAEKQFEQAAQEWRTTFDSITDLISIRDKDNRIIRVNKATADMLKTTPKELIGKFCYEVMHGAKEPPVNCPHWQALINGKPIEMETFNSDLGVYFQESASPIFDESGEITGSVVVARDVTKQKRMEEQLIMTDRLASIGELSSGIAHELNNPLTSVIGFSQLLMEGEVPEDIKKDLGIVYSEAQRAAAIVKNLLTFARKHAPVKQLSQVNTVIEDVLRLRAYEQKVNNIEVESRLAPNLPEIMIDHFQMQQVFLNIVVNAEFAMQEAHQRGKLIIKTERSDGVIRITFTDDGPGISQENLKHIFDPFFTTKEVGKGTGLGLSICHGIVTEHGGKIYARSKEGMGASFIIQLPINE